MTRDPAAMLREHLGAPGAPIVNPGPVNYQDRWQRSSTTWCGGELRAMYVRQSGAPPARRNAWLQDKPKLTWRRVGYVCLRCGVVELHADVLPFDDPTLHSWDKADRARRPGAVLVPGALAAAPTTETTECPDCLVRVTSSNLARHRKRRHSPTSAGVDTASSGTRPPSADDQTFVGWAPGELTEAHGR